ncbi:MAG: hypothetical protein M3Z75_16430 [Actinomycetota bacterium]|nr:hypothetical protein [Actinomycetota bacterium]
MPSNRRTAATLGWLLTVLVMVSACGGSAPSDGARYEQIVNPANAIWATFVTQARGWPGGAIPASGAALTQDVVQTWERTNRQLLARHWPGPTQSDIAALARSDSGVCQTLERLPAPGAVDRWWTSLTASFSAEQAAARRVRLDLRLPTSPGPQGSDMPAAS